MLLLLQFRLTITSNPTIPRLLGVDITTRQRTDLGGVGLNATYINQFFDE